MLGLFFETRWGSSSSDYFITLFAHHKNTGVHGRSFWCFSIYCWEGTK